MKRDDKYTRLSFLCAGCLKGEEAVVPTTTDIMKDYDKAEAHMLSYGWTVKKVGHDTLYYCKRCSNKGNKKDQERFVQNTLFD